MLNEKKIRQTAGKADSVEKINELEKIISKNKNDLKSYLEIILKQQKALINNNISELEESIINQEKVLNIISENQALTAELMDNILTENNLEIKNPGMNEFMKSIKNIYTNEYFNLSVLKKSISDLSEKIIDVNRKNKILIDHSRNFIKELLTALSNSNKPVFDRKI